MLKDMIIALKNYTKNPDTSMFKMHTHNYYEIFCFLSGKAKYFIEGTIYDLKPNDILIINKSEAHTLLIKSNAPYERYVINFSPEALLGENSEKLLEFIKNKPLGQHNHYPSSLFDTQKLIYYLENLCLSDNIDDQRLYLTVFLKELSLIDNKISENNKHYSDDISVIIRYINEKITEEISLQSICKIFNFSQTHLNRKFKQVVGTTIWEYILTKRLLKAKSLLNNGISPTTVFINCGFNDYCTFYRNYKNKFGISPKDDFIKK